MSVYLLLNPRIPSWGSLWGGIADITLRGWCVRGRAGLLELTRAGPFVPPISLPESDMGRMIWEVVINDELRKMLEVSGLSGFTFRPIVKRHIIHMEWEKWALSEIEPPEPLETYQFLDYFSNQSHDPQIASDIGDLWELCLDYHAELEPAIGVVNWDGADLFRVKDSTQDTDYLYVSEKAKSWLQQMVPEWVTFIENRPLVARRHLVNQMQNQIVIGDIVLGEGQKMVHPGNKSGVQVNDVQSPTIEEVD